MATIKVIFDILVLGRDLRLSQGETICKILLWLIKVISVCVVSLLRNKSREMRRKLIKAEKWEENFGPTA